MKKRIQVASKKFYKQLKNKDRKQLNKPGDFLFETF